MDRQINRREFLRDALVGLALPALTLSEVSASVDTGRSRRQRETITPTDQAQVVPTILGPITTERWNLSFSENQVARAVAALGGDELIIDVRMSRGRWQELGRFADPTRHNGFQTINFKDRYPTQHVIVGDSHNKVAISRPWLYADDSTGDLSRREFGYIPLKGDNSLLEFRFRVAQGNLLRRSIANDSFRILLQPERHVVDGNSYVYIEPGLNVNRERNVTNPDGNTPVAYTSGLLNLFQSPSPVVVVWSNDSAFRTDTREHLSEPGSGRHNRHSPPDTPTLLLLPRQIALFNGSLDEPRDLIDVRDSIVQLRAPVAPDSAFGNAIRQWVSRDRILYPTNRPRTEQDHRNDQILLQLGGGGGIWNDLSYHLSNDREGIREGRQEYLYRTFSRCLTILEDKLETPQTAQETLAAYKLLPPLYRQFFEKLMRETYEEFKRHSSGENEAAFFPRLINAPQFLDQLLSI